MTDRIDTFTERGIGLESARELEELEELAADITVTATGLNLLAFGGITFTVNGEPANLSDKVAFKAHCWFFRSDSKSSSEQPVHAATRIMS